MANRFWVGGTGNWSDTARWSATSGGAGGASVPGTNDAAIFNASSGAGTATVDSNVTVQTLTMTGYTGTLAFGTNTISLNSTGTVYTGATTFTVTGTPVINVTSAGSTAITVSPTAVTEANSISFNFTGGTYNLTLSSGSYRNLTFTGYAGALQAIPTSFNCYGNLTLSTGMTLTAGTNALIFAATSGTKTITSNGKTMDFPVTFNGAGGTWSLQDAMTVGTATARTLTLTAGTLELSSSTLTLYGTFSSTGTGVRKVQMSGSGGKIVLTQQTVSTVFDTTTVTNLTTDGNVLVQLSSSGAATKTISAGAMTEANKPFSFQLSLAAGTAAFTASNTIQNLTIDNSAFTLTNVAITIYGSLTISGTSPTLNAGANVWTFAATSGTKNITTSGKTLDFPITFNGAGGTWALQDALTVGTSTARTITLTAGTISLGSNTFTFVGSFVSSNSNVRGIDFGTGKIITTSTGSIWQCATATNFTATGSGYFESANDATTNKTIAHGNTANSGETSAINLRLTTTTTVGTNGVNETWRIENNCVINNLTFNCFQVWEIGVNTGTPFFFVYGNLDSLVGGGITSIPGSLGISFATTSGKTSNLNCNGANLGNVTINGAGTVQLTSAFSSSGTLNLTAGTFSGQTYNVTTGAFNSNNSNVRTLNMGSGTWTSTGGTTNAWNITTSTNLTLNKDTANIILSTSGAVTFTGGSKTYNNLTFSSTTATNAITIAGSNTFGILSVAAAGRDLTLTAGTTTTVSMLDLNGDSATTNFSILKTTVNGSTATLSYAGSNFNTCGYVNAQDIIGSPANRWYMARSSLNSGNNTNLIFGDVALYWVGGSGTWSGSSGSNWATTSGGAATSFYPTEHTDIYFDANSDSGTDFTVTVGAGSLCRHLDVSGLDKVMTLSGSGDITLGGNINVTVSPANFIESYTGTVTLVGGVGLGGAVSSTITTNGNSFSTFIFNGAGATWTLQDALTLTDTATLTTGTLALSSYSFTCTTFFSSGTGIRSINFGTGKIVLTSSSTEIVWDTTINTSLTISGSLLVQLTGGGATTKTISAGTAVINRSYNFQLSTTSGTVTFTSGNGVKNLIIDNNSFTLSNVAITIYGDLTIAGTTPTLTAGTNIWTFAGTAGTQTITTNGMTLDFPITFSGTGTYSLGSALSVGASAIRTVTFTTGTLELNSYNFTIFGVFSGSGTGTRRIQMSGSGGKFVISRNTSGTVWATPVVTNLSTDGNILVQITGLGSQTISAGALSEANAISFQLSLTSGSITFVASNTLKNITFDNNAFSITNIALTIYGNLLISGTSPTLTAGVNAWTFATTGTQTITTNGKTLDFPITFNGIGGTCRLLSALTLGSTRTLTHTNGTLDLNGFTLTTGTSYTTAAGTKNLTFNGGTLTCPSSGATSFNNAAPTGFTTTAGTGTGTINMTSASAKTFVGGGSTYNCTLNNGGAGALTITDSNTFITLANSVQPTTFSFTAGTTTTLTNWNINGTAGNLVTIQSGTAASHTLSKASGTINANYLSISYSNATGGATWYAGAASTDGGNNSGWIFANAPVIGYSWGWVIG